MTKVKQLILDITQGNLGAMRVVKELQWFSKWFDIMQYCKAEGIIGGKLWELYKDKYKYSAMALGEYLQDEMYKDKRNYPFKITQGIKKFKW